jgi:ribonuclease HI
MGSTYTIYTDGGCDPNPGPGGYGIVILEAGKEPREISGGEPKATNNRMEMRAALEALRAVDEGSVVDLFTDSQYLRNGVTQWLAGWKARGWKTSTKEPVKNQDLWEALDVEIGKRKVRWHWTRGHSGDHWNERADQLATRGIPRATGIALEQGALALYCGVSYSGKDESGAYAAFLRYVGEAGAVEKAIERRFAGESANRLHLLSVLEPLEALKRPLEIHVHTASDYVRDGVTRWIDAWRKRDWKTKEGKDVSHRDLWERLARAVTPHRIHWHVPAKEGEIPPEMEKVKARAHDVRTGVTAAE